MACILGGGCVRYHGLRIHLIWPQIVTFPRSLRRLGLVRRAPRFDCQLPGFLIGERVVIRVVHLFIVSLPVRTDLGLGIFKSFLFLLRGRGPLAFAVAPAIMETRIDDGTALRVHFIGICSQPSVGHGGWCIVHNVFGLEISWIQRIVILFVSSSSRQEIVPGLFFRVPIGHIVFQEDEFFMISSHLARCLKRWVLTLPLRGENARDSLLPQFIHVGGCWLRLMNKVHFRY